MSKMRKILKEINRFFYKEPDCAGIFAFGAFVFVVLVIIFCVL